MAGSAAARVLPHASINRPIIAKPSHLALPLASAQALALDPAAAACPHSDAMDAASGGAAAAAAAEAAEAAAAAAAAAAARAA